MAAKRSHRTADCWAHVGLARGNRGEENRNHDQRHADCGCTMNNAYMQHSLRARGHPGTAHLEFRFDRSNALREDGPFHNIMPDLIK